MKVTIPLLPQQREFLQATEKKVAIYSSRACGKSYVLVLLSLLKMMDGQHVIYGVQNLDAWDKGPRVHLEHFLDLFGVRDAWSWNGSTYTGTLQTKYGQAKLYLTTYVRPDAARGATEVSLLALDEFALSTPQILGIYAPCLRGKDLQGRDIHPLIRMVSTPNMLSMWQLLMVEHDKYGIRMIRAKLSDNVFLTDEQKETMSASIFDEKLRRQELEGEIILGEDATSLIALKDFKTDRPPISDDTIYCGLDMAHTGQRDSHSFAAIKGNRLLALHEFGICDAMSVATYIRQFRKAHSNDKMQLNIDLAWSESIYDQIKYEIPSTQISFAEKAPTEEAQRTYANIRAFGYFKCAKLLKNGLCVDEESEWIDEGLVAEFKREITNTHFILNLQGKLLIEPKDDIKLRLGRSPDPADALMLACLDRSEGDDPQIMTVRQTDMAQRRRWANTLMG